jgi:hypothetical protein
LYVSYLEIFKTFRSIKTTKSITQISKAIYSPILGQTLKWFRINSFGLITCYRPGSNQFKRNLLFKTYFNSWLWCVNLVDFHFFLKFLNFISISNSQNHLWTLHWRELANKFFSLDSYSNFLYKILSPDLGKSGELSIGLLMRYLHCVNHFCQ